MGDICEQCLEHSGIKEKVRELCDFKKDMTQSTTGIIDKIKTSLEKKCSKAMLITFAFLMLTLVSTLFGLVYHSNSKVLHEMVSIKTNIGMINDKLK